MGNVYVLAVVLSVSWHTTLLGTKMGFIQHGTSTEGKERWSTWQGNGDFAPDHNKRHCDITHQSHSEDQCVEIKDFFLTLLWCPLDCTNINFCCWYTYSVILSDAILFNLLLTPVHFFSLICLSVPLTSLSSLLFFCYHHIFSVSLIVRARVWALLSAASAQMY